MTKVNYVKVKIFVNITENIRPGSKVKITETIITNDVTKVKVAITTIVNDMSRPKDITYIDLANICVKSQCHYKGQG